MKSSYIYAGTYAQVLQHGLLSQNQRELIVSASSLSDLKTVLQDTFAGTDFADAEDIEDFYSALDSVMMSAKKTLQSISPDQKILSLIWLQYDYYNLKHMAKAQQKLKQETEGESYKPVYSGLGNHSTVHLYDALLHRKLALLDTNLDTMMRTVGDPKTTASIDAIADRSYLTNAYEIATVCKSYFAQQFISLLIDLYNIRARLRSIAQSNNPTMLVHDVFVANGTIDILRIKTTDAALQRLTQFGGTNWWEAAINSFYDHGDFTDIDTAADNYVMKWLKSQSIQIHSEASLFAYFYSVRENTQFIRAVIAAINTGIDEVTLRRLLRTSLKSYVY